MSKCRGSGRIFFFPFSARARWGKKSVLQKVQGLWRQFQSDAIKIFTMNGHVAHTLWEGSQRDHDRLRASIHDHEDFSFKNSSAKQLDTSTHSPSSLRISRSQKSKSWTQFSEYSIPKRRWQNFFGYFFCVFILYFMNFCWQNCVF